MPVHDDRQLFEMLCLEGAQAGLSWITILRKRETYRKAFDGFDAEKMARYGAAKRRRLLQDPGIVRNRLKVDAFISNAKAYLEIRASRSPSTTTSGSSPTARCCAAGRCIWATLLPSTAAQRRDEQGSQDNEASVSSDRLFATRSCRPWGSSMNINVIAGLPARKSA